MAKKVGGDEAVKGGHPRPRRLGAPRRRAKNRLEQAANELVFPELRSANLDSRLPQRLGGAEAAGPILMGMRRPVHPLQHGRDVRAIVNMAAIAPVDAQRAPGDGPQPAAAPAPVAAPAEREPAPVA